MPQVVQEAPPETEARTTQETTQKTTQQATPGPGMTDIPCPYAVQCAKWGSATSRWGIYTASLIASLFIAIMRVHPILGLVGFVFSVIGIIWTAQSYFAYWKSVKQTRHG